MTGVNSTYQPDPDGTSSAEAAGKTYDLAEEIFGTQLNIKCSNKTYILVDESKIVNRLGSKFPVPVECTPKAINLVKEEIYKQGAHNVELRLAQKKKTAQ